MLAAALLTLFLTAPINALAEDSCRVETELPFNGASYQRLSEEIAASDDGLKSKSELNHYMDCFKVKAGGSYPPFDTHYSKYVERAATAYGIPYPLLACLLYVETKWDKNSASGVGAIGLSQLVLGKGKSSGFVDTMLSAKDNSEKLRKADESFAANMRSRRLNPTDAKYIEERSVLDAEIKNNAIRAMLNRNWSDYWGGTHKKVTPISDKALRTPETAIALGAYYLKYIMLSFDLKSNTPFARLLLATGAYNIGPGAFMRTYRKANPRSFETIRNMYAKAGNYETSDHMDRVHACAKKGLWKATWCVENDPKALKNRAKDFEKECKKQETACKPK